jgi:hypothetical protein
MWFSGLTVSLKAITPTPQGVEMLLLLLTSPGSAVIVQCPQLLAHLLCQPHPSPPRWRHCQGSGRSAQGMISNLLSLQLKFCRYDQEHETDDQQNK